MSAPDDGRRLFSVSVHDVAPATWPECAALLELADAVRAPATLLVVPHFHGGEAIDANPAVLTAIRARLAAGDDVALHGYFHRDDSPAPRGPREWLRRRVYTADEGEFDSLGADEANRRIAGGMATLNRIGFAPRGFVAPAWLMGAGCRTALRDQSVPYTCTRTELIEVASGRRVAAPSLVFSARSGWRRLLSRAVNRARLRSLAEAPFIRVALHPADARHPGLVRAWRSLLGELAENRRPVLERDALASVA